MARVETHGKAEVAACVQALRKAWDKDSECFRCYYSGIRLVEDNYKDPRYITFDRLIMEKDADLVITASIIKDMKSDMSSDEFKTIINQLAKHFEDGTAVDETIFKIKYWR